jgi:hypothetical protein
LWCNARKKALAFYLSIGFENVSAEFELPFIGPHYTLYLKNKLIKARSLQHFKFEVRNPEIFAEFGTRKSNRKNHHENNRSDQLCRKESISKS